MIMSAIIEWAPVVCMVFMFIAVILLSVVLKKLNYIADRLDDVKYVVAGIDNSTDELLNGIDELNESVADLSKEFECCSGCCCVDDKEDEEDEDCEDICTRDLKFDDPEAYELDIHLITPEQYLFENTYPEYNLVYIEETDTLRYYTGVIEYVEIANVEELIGEGLRFFGVNSNGDDVVYIRNNKFGADFRIRKVSADESREL